MARPTKLTTETADQIVAYILAGSHRKTAARAAGVSEASYHRWMTDPRPPFRAFQRRIERAEAILEVDLVETWHRHTKRSPRAAERFLRARFPERWGPNACVIDLGDDPAAPDAHRHCPHSARTSRRPKT